MNKKIILVLILLLAFGLRFWRLNEFPALNADEAAIGYNAYSLIQTGMDEHGNPWPIHFQSFNDYKPGLYFYIVLPFVKFIGLSEWAVRIPGAAMGVATVLVVYLLVNEISRETRDDKNNSKFSIFNFQFSTAEVAALFLAISPWHIHFSRGGWEVNVATFFMTTGLWLFIRWVNRKGRLPNLVLSLLAFVLSLYTYHAARVIVPLLGLGMGIIYFKDLWKQKKQVFVALAIGVILLLPLVKDLSGPAGFSRAAGVGIFSDPGPLNEINEQRGEHPDLQGLAPKLLHNKPINYSLAILQNWSEHFSGEFLFLSGDDIQRNKVPEMGEMYLHDALFVIIGLFALFKLVGVSKHWRMVALWFVVAPIPAALTFQSPHALRAQNMVIPLVLLSALGLMTLVNWYRNVFKNKLILNTFYLLLAAMIVWEFARYQHLYWVQMPRSYPYSSQYGVKELIKYVKENNDKYDTVIITDRYDQPYILTLFYLKYPPEKFQGNHSLTARDGFGFSTVRSFDKYRFFSIKWPSTPNEYKNSLIVGTDEEIPDAANIVNRIEFPNGETAFEIVAN